MTVRQALILSDVHLGWVVCERHHRDLLARLPEAADEADLVVLNGDVFDTLRGAPRPAERALWDRMAALVEAWRGEGRRVVYVEGNHDPREGGDGRSGAPLCPDRWRLDFEGHHGERVRVLHGHRFDDGAFSHGLYGGFGRHVIRLENHLYGRLGPLRAVYPAGPGWLVGAIGRTEDLIWRPRLPGRLGPLLRDVDVLVHGHLHFGPGRGALGGVPCWRSGAWVSRGHRGSVDRILRYREGRFERVGLVRGRWRALDDGR